MPTPRLLLAWLLLLCLGRTLLPEAWVLALHRHEHTTVEPAQAPAFRRTGKALISAQHQHCPVEQFYDVAYQGSVPVVVPGPRVALRYAAAPALPPVRPAAGEVLYARSLRGPPARA
ncbi:MAG: hypothetical protein M3Y12_14510 [Bacteroidota bacterium]|nr:hypothetical protein [Bacteroidota bacterium]